MFKPSIVSSEIKYSGKRLSLRNDTVDCGKDGLIIREVVEHPGAVVILPLLGDERLVLIRQYRHPIGAPLYEFPAGTLEAGEAPHVCADRELTEEANYRAGSLLPLGHLYPAPGFCNEKQYLFLATDLTLEQGNPDPGEIIETEYFSVSQFKKMVIDGLITDAKSISIFSRALFMDLLPKA